MQHRHNGVYVSKTPKGRVVYKKRPIHSQALMNKNKDLNYKQLRRKFAIAANSDDDKDGVINRKDCHPWDKKRQDETPDEIYSQIQELEAEHRDAMYKLEKAKEDMKDIQERLNEKLEQYQKIRPGYKPMI